MSGSRIRIGIVGANLSYGWGTRAHIPAIKGLPELELTAVCTTRQETAEETARQFDIPMAFHDPQEMVNHPEVDLVSVCVKVPSHHQLVMATLQAGKHVFCEWPLGANLSEAVEMRDLAEARGVRHMVGLQARGAPAFNRIKELVEEGYIGDVLSCRLLSTSRGGGRRPLRSAWAVDRTRGANTLTIAGGHSLDVLCFCLGEFREVSSQVTTHITEATVIETGEVLEVTSPDNVLVTGTLESGARASVQIRSTPTDDSGFLFEVYGSEGTLVASARAGAQTGEVALRGARKGGSAMEEIPIPASHYRVPNTVPAGPPWNVGQLFQRLAEGIRNGTPASPDFNLAVTRHRLLEAIERSSERGRPQVL